MALGGADEDGPDTWTDAELIAELRVIDEDDDADVSDWEAKFMSTVFNQTTLSDRQREKAIEIINDRS
jgi:hypothetical protein